MKKLLLSFLLLFTAQASKADYDPLPLPYVIIKSDLIIDCTINEIKLGTIEVIVNETVKGYNSEKKLIVNQFIDWTCASRWAAYKVGQRQLFFLRKKGTELEIIGVGNEGEMPIIGDSLYHLPQIGGGFNSKKAAIYKFDDGDFYAFRFDLKTAKEGIREFLRLCPRLKEMIADKSIISYYSENGFVNLIVDEFVLSNFEEEAIGLREYEKY